MGSNELSAEQLELVTGGGMITLGSSVFQSIETHKSNPAPTPTGPTGPQDPSSGTGVKSAPFNPVGVTF